MFDPERQRFGVRSYTVIAWSVVSLFAIVTLASLPTCSGRHWTSALPPQFEIGQRLSYGSRQNGAGTCGAVIYQLSYAQTQKVRRRSIEAFPADLKGPDGLQYEQWAETPVPNELYERYILNTAGLPVGLDCSHGTWEKEWRANAEKSGNYYTTNGKALILLQVSDLQVHPNYLAAVGYFYNP